MTEKPSFEGYLIDVTRRKVRRVTFTGTAEWRILIGGSPAMVCTWPSNDACYIDDCGLLKVQLGYFRMPTARPDCQPLAGNALVVGAEIVDADNNLVGFHPPSITLEDLRREVEFLSHEYVRAWGRAHASEPALKAVSFGLDAAGRLKTSEEVIARFGSMFSGMPEPTEPNVTDVCIVRHPGAGTVLELLNSPRGHAAQLADVFRLLGVEQIAGRLPTAAEIDGILTRRMAFGPRVDALWGTMTRARQEPPAMLALLLTRDPWPFQVCWQIGILGGAKLVWTHSAAVARDVFKALGGDPFVVRGDGATTPGAWNLKGEQP